MGFPNFIVIGAAKSGTTSLWYYLDNHPEVYMSPIKETNYFAHDLMSSTQEINSMKLYKSLFDNSDSYIARGEVSNIYLTHADKVAERIKQSIPECKIVVILRSPVDRLYSRYWHVLRDRYTLESFESFSNRAREIEILSNKIKIYINKFGEMNLKIIFLEDIENNWKVFAGELFPFIGVSVPKKINKRLNVSGKTKSKFINNYIVKGPAWVRAPAKIFKPKVRASIRTYIQKLNTKEKPSIDPKIKTSLLDYYEDEIKEINRIAGRVPGNWLNN